MSSLLPIQEGSPRRQIILRTNRPLPKTVSPLKDHKNAISSQKNYWISRRLSPQKIKIKNFNYYFSNEVVVFQKRKPKNQQIKPLVQLKTHKSQQKYIQQKIKRQKSNEILINKNIFRVQLKSKSSQRNNKYFLNNPKQVRNIATSYYHRKKDIIVNIDAWQTPHQLFQIAELM